jgi:predicted dehydrogenase
MNSLVVGLGIGQLYVDVFKKLGHIVDTVDPSENKNATYKSHHSIEKKYDIAVICTPNFTHEAIARDIADNCKIVLIEKPGVKDRDAWKNLLSDFPNTRFMMVKNNQYRPEIKAMQHQMVHKPREIKLLWENKNRVPNPGSWFTTKELAFGGVSRDLIPHLLSYFTLLSDYTNANKISWGISRIHTLAGLQDTDYGTANPHGTYDVDDVCQISYAFNGQVWTVEANWKSDVKDEISITFDRTVAFPLGLCPESAYETMVLTALENVHNKDFWDDQAKQDLWIHGQLDKL